MGKRKRKHSGDEIRRKIRRLERKLRDKSGDRNNSEPHSRDRYRRSSLPYSSDDQRDSYSDDGNRSERDIADREYSDSSINMEDLRASSERLQSVISAVPAQVSAPCSLEEPVPTTSRQQPATAAEPTAPATTAEATTVVNEVPLSDMTVPSEIPQEILNILGEAKKVDQALGEKVPGEISKRWGEILVDGLAKEQRESLTEKMLIPENFLLARAPKLNPEVAAVLTDTVKNRDKRLEKAQNQLGTGLAGLVNLTKDLIKTDMDKLEIIRRISEVSQILLDLHYEETVNRRKLIIPLLDKKFWNTIQGVKREEFLFGDKLGENIKNTKDIEKSSQHIKKPTLNQPFQRKNIPTGNSRAPPRQQTGAKPATTAATRYQPSTSRRSTQQRGRPTSSNKHHDRRRR